MIVTPMIEKIISYIETELPKVLRSLVSLLNLRADMDEAGTMEHVRANITFRSANAWTLVFAIFIASIGLNTNSTAVVIGAMLISPLMGPIVGAGVGLGVNDLPLVKRSLTNLMYAVAISLVASFLYFTLSPLSEAQSELLARTRPTFFDAMIAIFGGAAGIVALSRKEKGNAIPGVAIATALMPPLCTAGYGLSKGNFSFFLGAMYLFLINSVYICLSTLFFIKYLGFQKVASPNPDDRIKLRRWLTATAALVLLPSLVSAWLLLRETSFRSRANSFVKKELQLDGTFVVGTEINYNWRKPKLIVNLIGEPLTEPRIQSLKESMLANQLPVDALEIRQSSLAEKIEQRIKSGMQTEKKEIQEAELRAATLEIQLSAYKKLGTLSSEVSSELKPLFPRLNQVAFISTEEGASPKAEAQTKSQIPPLAIVEWQRIPVKADLSKVDSFLKSRTKEEDLRIAHVNLIRKIEPMKEKSKPDQKPDTEKK